MNGLDKSMVKVRPMAGSDVDPVLGLWWASFMANRDMVAAELGGRLDMSLVAEFEGRLVGCILAKINFSGSPIKEVCVVHAVVVEPAYRRQGMATLLINQLRSLCSAKGIPTMRGMVSKDNIELINYFNRLGFTPSNIINLDQAS